MTLHFRDDGSFTIALFTDVHWRSGDDADQRTAHVMDAILAAAQPDLVVFNGDTIDGAHCEDPAMALRAALAPVTARGLPWAAVFGNHDDEGALDRAQLMEKMQALPGCLAEPGPAALSGVGNYVRTVDGRDGKPAARLYFLDSHAYARTDVGGYGWFERDQIAWYLETAAAARQAQGRVLPALAFFHIPLSEYNEMWDLHTCRGIKGEAVCCPLVNTGMFAALHEAAEVLGVFVGHDHLNDFIGELYGIRLAFGRVSGYSGYGDHAFVRGARMIRLRQGVYDFDSWLHLDGGEIIREQALHAPEVNRPTCVL
jgi:hypothetical protein